MKTKLKKRVLLAALLMAYLLSVFRIDAFAADFPDVTSDHLNYTAVTDLVEYGVIAGYDDGYFRPDREITRTEFCALMARTLGYSKDTYEAGVLPFPDVKDGYWGYDYISFCYELGLIDGMGDGTFWPAEKVTLAQTAKMAVCAIGEQEKALSIKGDKWYDGYVEVAEDYDLFYLVVGEVADNAIRSDIAQIVYNMTETGLTDAGQDEPAFEDDETLDEEIENPEDDREDEVEKDHISPEIRAAYKEKDFSNVETILIDAGHNYSGRDTGAENTELQIKEEDITWQIADKLRRNLEDMGYNVVMTREKITDSIANTSVLESLQARVDLGHESRADLFISIHCNAGGGSGTEVYCFQKSGYAGRLAELVQDSIASNTELYDRGVKTANFFVIQNTLMPAILIETGFIDNIKDAQILASEDGQQAIAEAIAESVAVYDDMDPIVETISKTMDNQQDEETNEETEQEEEQW